MAIGSRASHLKRKFGITEEQYEHQLERQNGCCAVCGKKASSFKRKLAVDHDHTTGEIRGLLCLFCNKYIVGRHRRGSGDSLLRAAYEYLNREYTGWVVPVRKKKRRCRRKKKKHI